jgi:flagellar biosynthetic protein FlhB
MSDEQEQDNRTEEPTARRRQQARDEGRIARSQEFGAAAMLLAGAVFLAGWGGRAIGQEAIDLFRSLPARLLEGQPSAEGFSVLLRTITFRAAVAMAPLAIGLSIVGIAVGLLQSRGSASWKPIYPDFTRISPLTGFGRIFGTEALFNLAKALLKLGALGTVVVTVLRGAWPHFVALGEQGPADIVAALRSSTLRMSLAISMAFLAIGALDYLVQFFRHEKSLKMSRQDVIQEHREQEGDPQIKARIRQIARQRTRQRMLSQVAKADVVITNPTHLAIALKYDVATAGAPVVVAMGERKLAERIKSIARQAGVPMVENKPLARALLATCTVGAPIPPAMYVAVAEILAYVYRIRSRGVAALAGRGT